MFPRKCSGKVAVPGAGSLRGRRPVRPTAGQKTLWATAHFLIGKCALSLGPERAGGALLDQQGDLRQNVEQTTADRHYVGADRCPLKFEGGEPTGEVRSVINQKISISKA